MNSRLILALLSALAVGCGSEPDTRVFGTFRLVGVEGNTLPYLESSDAECDRFISEGELRLVENGTYSLEFSGPEDCTRGGGQIGTMGRFYNGTATQNGRDVTYSVTVQGAGIIEFSGTVNPLEAFVTAPPLPPATGPDLVLQFAVVP